MYVVRNAICSCGNDTYNKSIKEWTCCNCGKKTIRTYHNMKSRDISDCSNYEMFIEHCTPSQLKQVEVLNSREYLTFNQGCISYGIAYIIFKDEYTYQSFSISGRGKKKEL